MYQRLPPGFRTSGLAVSSLSWKVDCPARCAVPSLRLRVSELSSSPHIVVPVAALYPIPEVFSGVVDSLLFAVSRSSYLNPTSDTNKFLLYPEDYVSWMLSRSGGGPRTLG